MSEVAEKSRDKKLSEKEQISAKIYILENRVTEMRLVDAQANLAAIELATFLNASTLSHEESVAFVENETSNATVAEYAKAYLSASSANVARARKHVESIIEGVA